MDVAILLKGGRAKRPHRIDEMRPCQRDEVADTVLWLCLPESRSITGQASAVAGGEVT